MDQVIKTYSEKELLPKLIEWTKSRPDDIKALYYLGNIAIAAGDITQAENTFNHALKVAKLPQDKAQLTSLLAASYYQRYVLDNSKKDYLDKAEATFLEVLKTAPRDVKTLNNLAYLYADDKDDPDKALPRAELAAKIQPDSNVLDTYGWVLLKKADHLSGNAQKDLYAQAQKVLERSVELDPATANRYHMGCLYEKIGRTKDAKNLYQQVWELIRNKPTDPLYKPVKDALDRLGR